MRLAEEYDAAQDRAEVTHNGERGKAIPDENGFSDPATASDLGLARKDIHEARRLFDNMQSMRRVSRYEHLSDCSVCDKSHERRVKQLSSDPLL